MATPRLALDSNAEPHATQGTSDPRLLDQSRLQSLSIATRMIDSKHPDLIADNVVEDG
jgi:hypothetical protein